MTGNIFRDQQTIRFVISGILVFVLIFVVEKINGRFWLNDFKVMYLAADALLNNEPVYGTPFGLGTGFYKYSPFTLLLFIPYTIVSFDIASVVHFFISGFAALGTVILIEQIIRVYLVPVRKKTFLTLTAVLFCAILHLVRELHLGNINMILLFLLSLSLYCTLRSKPALSAILLALAILAKPYFIICLLPLLANKRFKEVLFTGVSVLLFIISSAIVIGFSKSITLYQEWFVAMMEHSDYLFSNHTVFALINTYLGEPVPTKYSLVLLILIGVLLSFYFWKFTNITKEKHNSGLRFNGGLIINFFLLIAIVPSILITDTEHFLFSLPLIAILLFHLPKDKVWPLLLFVLLVFMYEGNSSDLLGRGLSGKVDGYGILGISNLVITGTVMYLFLRNKSRISIRENQEGQNN